MKTLPTSAWLLAILIFSAAYSTAQTTKPRIAPASTWIKQIDYDPTARPPEDEAENSYYLLIDEQENSLAQERYTHHAYKILTSQGLREMSDITVDFDPSYQQLVFHSLQVVRDGKAFNKLPKDIRVVQRESSMERHLYDGRNTAVVNLTDVRTGDIVEFSYTVKGYNPVFGNRISRWIYFNYRVGYEKLFKRIVMPANREPVLTKSRPELVPMQKQMTGLGIEYTWEVEKGKAVMPDGNLPGWYDPYAFVGISDFHTWSEVAVWANGLFSVPASELAIITKQTREMFKGDKPKDNALAIVRFVQDEVRYLGFETGLNSHKPHAPAKVLQQRFGDCKDKSLLLACMLKAVGIEAYPVLVNSNMRHTIRDFVPGPFLFDHCVVKIRMNDDNVYVDPTISGQGGSLGSMHFPSYGAGLVVAPHTDDLEALPTISRADVSESYVIDSPTFSGDATLTVTTTYKGSSADFQREHFAGTNLQEIQKNYLDFYAASFTDIESLDNIKFDDDRLANVFVVHELYRIPQFWKPQSDGVKGWRSEWYSLSIESYFNVDESSKRSMPYALAYPRRIAHHVTLRLPEDWSLDEDRIKISGDAYAYSYESSLSKNVITATTFYETKADHVKPFHYAKFIEDHSKMMENLSFVFTYDPSLATAHRNPVGGTIVSLICLIAGVFGVVKLYKRFDPKAFIKPGETPEAIGGWLVFLGIAVVISPFRIAWDVLSDTSVIDGSLWTQWFSSGDYALASFALFVHVYNIVSIFFSALLMVLFFQRRTSFPRLMSIGLAVTFIVVTADTLVAKAIVPDPSQVSSSDMIRSLFGAIIWIPYLNLSSRVKETFAIRYKEDEIQDSQATPDPWEVPDATTMGSTHGQDAGAE